MKGTLIHIISALGLCLITQTIFHEIGHFIGGVISGWKLLYIQIYKLALKRNTKTNKFNIVWVDELSYQCIMYPKSLETNAFLYTLGGCIANLITGLMGMLLLILVKMDLVSWIYTWCFSAYGIGFSIMNIIADVQRVCNDGACYKFLKSSDQTKLCHNAQLLLAKKLIAGLSYRQIGKELICLCPSVAGNDIEAYQAILEYYYYLDISNYSEMKNSLDKIKGIKNISNQVLNIFKLELTYQKILSSLINQDNSSNNDLEDMDYLKLPYKNGNVHSIRVKSAVKAYKRLSEGDVMKAVEIINEAINYIDRTKFIYDGEKFFCIRQLKKLKNIIVNKYNFRDIFTNQYCKNCNIML